MSKLLTFNLHVFLKLYLSRLCNAMAIGKGLILLYHYDLNFYTALIKYISLHKNTHLWSISRDLNSLSSISKEYEVERRESLEISNTCSTDRNESSIRRAVTNICT